MWILRRSDAELAALAADDGRVADPASLQSVQAPYARNPYRSLRPELFVAIGLCTHQGCVPARSGGHLLCSCHTAKYDLAGRVFSGGPAPRNLTIPAYRLADESRLVIGEDA
ncbi:Rieske 2Fe-2S domain-containing protein [Azospira restricta]|uniref:Rieske 2Fe-2S domain-containing protein n=1 Tax=Azospira restricta TaxID=404405 RepID=UPI001EEFE6F4|nr:Rieske 2Fe-2S domain-containing protein [Azospira restricta]